MVVTGLVVVVTGFVVVVTGNHWWSDGIVATLILVASAWSVRGIRHVWHAVRPAGQDVEPPQSLEPASA